MHQHPVRIAKIRAQIYYVLAEALAEPPDWLAHLTIGSPLLEALAGGAQHLGSPACGQAAAWLAGLPDQDAKDLRVRYAALFLVPGHPATAYESLACEGRLLGDASLKVRRWYDAVGLAPTDELPDHVSVELAFLGHLTEEEAQAAERGDLAEATRLRKHQARFLAEHPGRWLPTLGETLAQSGDPVYAALGRLLSGFIDEEIERLSQRKPRPVRSKSWRIPRLADPAGCTLCGFCVQVCKLRALRIEETERETRLLFKPGRCVGCDACQKVCPEAVLKVGQDGISPYSEGWQALKVSARVICPGCGQPYVSHAELDAICDRLEADASLRHRLSYCVNCKF